MLWTVGFIATATELPWDSPWWWDDFIAFPLLVGAVLFLVVTPIYWALTGGRPSSE